MNVKTNLRSNLLRFFSFNFLFSVSLFCVCECTLKSTVILQQESEGERRESYPGNIKLEILAKN